MLILSSTHDKDEREDAIYALGRANARDAAVAVAPFLDVDHAPAVREVALRRLVDELDRANLALDSVVTLAGCRTDGDPLGSTRLVAPQVAGVAFRRTRDKQLIRLVLQVALQRRPA